MTGKECCIQVHQNPKAQRGGRGWLRWENKSEQKPAGGDGNKVQSPSLFHPYVTVPSLIHPLGISANAQHLSTSPS